MVQNDKIIVLDYSGKITVFDLELEEVSDEYIGELARRIHIVRDHVMIQSLQGSLIKINI